MSNYSKIPDNAIFETTNGKFRKLDALYYEDLTAGLQSVWSPMFDATILGAGTEQTAAPAKTKYITDPQTRITKLNPNFNVNAAEEAFGEMWGSALFDCGPEDYTFMAEKSVQAITALEEMAKMIGVQNVGFDKTLEAVAIFVIANLPVLVEPKTPKKKVAKKAAKKVAKKAPAKRKRK